MLWKGTIGCCKNNQQTILIICAQVGDRAERGTGENHPSIKFRVRPQWWVEGTWPHETCL